MGKKSLQDWVEARRRHHRSHEQVQMARELGMNPRNLAKLDNHDQEHVGRPRSRRDGMSEYQYYEFQAIDRPLTRRELGRAALLFHTRASRLHVLTGARAGHAMR